MTTLEAGVEALLAKAEATLATSTASAELDSLRQRLHGPLRVAIAGRVKAGKSTLMNALVGERLAPTDASECTRIVTWYRFGEAYDVSAQLASGEAVALNFTREDGRLDVSMSEDLAQHAVRLDVAWPSSRLKGMTIIDTPGLGSVTEGVSERTEAALVGKPSEGADAVIYLLRHVHSSDVAFLEAFLDEQAAQVTPVNSVAVLSRADEIGAGRLDAMESARRIADRYAHDPRIRSLASAVVPVAGLLAETAATLEEREAEALRTIAREPADVREALLLSVDRFRTPDLGTLTVEIREGLLLRFGLFGVRLAERAFRDGRWGTATDLARLLTVESGVGTLQDVLRHRFAAHARQLVARSVLDSLRAIAESTAGAEAAALARDIEELEASAHEIAELRMLDLVWSGAATFSDDERAEAERLMGDGGLAERAGRPAGRLSRRCQSGSAGGRRALARAGRRRPCRPPDRELL